MILGRWSPEKRKRIRGLVRVGAYFSSITLVCGVISVRHARAEYENQTLQFGRQMLDLAKAANHEVTKITFNGQPLHVGSSVSDESPDTILRRYEDYCKAHRGQTDDFSALAGEPASTDAKSASPPDSASEAPALAKVGYVRTGEGDEGAVTCFVKGAKTKPTTAAAIEALLTTGELGALGELRHAYASKGRDGKTLVLTVWADSTFNFNEMMPADGQDAPGVDFPEIPRLPGSTRVMSANADGTPYGVNVYKTKDAPAKVLEFFDREMRAADWFTYDPEMTEAEHKGLGRAYLKNAVVVTVSTSLDPEGTFVSVGLAGVAKDDVLGRGLGRSEP